MTLSDLEWSFTVHVYRLFGRGVLMSVALAVHMVHTKINIRIARYLCGIAELLVVSYYRYLSKP